MEITFDPEDERFRAEIREFLADELTEELRQGARASLLSYSEPDIGLPWQSILNRRGWAAFSWPKGYGGTGWTPIQRYIFESECAYADAPSLPIAGLRLLGPVLHTFGTEEQKQLLLPRILSADDYWCQGFSEPGAGSDLASLKTRADRVADGYVVNGTKLWTTQAHYSNRIFCLVRTDQHVKAQAGISFMMLSMQQLGVSVTPILSLSGDHEVNQVFFDDARVETFGLLGAEGQGWTIAKFLLEHERAGTAFAPKLRHDLSLIRSNWSSALADAGRLNQISRLELEIEALGLMELRVLARVARGMSPGSEASIFKMVASTLRKDVDHLAVDMASYAGLQLPAGRPLYGADAPDPLGSRADQVAAARYLNSLAWPIFGGSNEIQKNIISRVILGLG